MTYVIQTCTLRTPWRLRDKREYSEEDAAKVVAALRRKDPYNLYRQVRTK